MEANKVFSATLVVLGVGFVIAGLLHVVFGLGADRMLGAGVSEASLLDAGLDNQNRFYGAAFTVYGVLLVIVSRNLAHYATILRAVMWVFLFAGLVRFVSVATHGWPPAMISALLFLELLIPPCILWWFKRIERQIHASAQSTLPPS